MKKIIALVIIAAIAISMTACGEKKQKKSKIDNILEKGYITMATSPDFAPSEFKNPKTGEVLGTDIEYGKKVAEYISNKYSKPIELKIEEMDFGACISAVATNNVDFSMNGFAITEERAENYYCAGPYAVLGSSEDTYHGALVKKGTSIKTTNDFKGLKVGAQQASLQYNLAVEQLPIEELGSLEYIANLTQGALMVATNKIDALITDSGAGELLIANNPDLEMAEFKFDFESEGNYALVNKHEKEFGDLITEALLAADKELNYSEVRQNNVEIAQSLGVEVNN